MAVFPGSEKHPSRSEWAKSFLGWSGEEQTLRKRAAFYGLDDFAWSRFDVLELAAGATAFVNCRSQAYGVGFIGSSSKVYRTKPAAGTGMQGNGLAAVDKAIGWASKP